MKNKSAFTLAEVLITLVIIGIIAALTIPAAIAKYKEQEIESRLKKAYSTVANGIKLSEIQNGPLSTWPRGADLTDMDNYWKTHFSPFFNGAKLCSSVQACGYKYDLVGTGWVDQPSLNICTVLTYGGSERFLFRLSDGTVIFYIFRSAHIALSTFYIDVNGPKEPNKYCKDVFPFNRDYDKNAILPTGCTVEHFKKLRG